MPVALQVTGKPSDVVKAQFLVRSGWVRSSQTTAGLSGTVETITDTVMSGTLTYLAINGVQPFVSLNVNAPTGKAVLNGTEANARMDPDLVEIGSFGEGWNIGPTVGAEHLAHRIDDAHRERRLHLARTVRSRAFERGAQSGTPDRAPASTPATSSPAR